MSSTPIYPKPWAKAEAKAEVLVLFDQDSMVCSTRVVEMYEQLASHIFDFMRQVFRLIYVLLLNLIERLGHKDKAFVERTNYLSKILNICKKN